ncbi:hypothetical protein GOODEAATRI_026656, partial [Goodea atripinnis]
NFTAEYLDPSPTEELLQMFRRRKFFQVESGPSFPEPGPQFFCYHVNLVRNAANLDVMLVLLISGQMFLSDVKPAVLVPCCRNLNADVSLLIRLSVLNPNPFLQQWKWSRVKASSCFFSPTKTSIDQISVCHEK